MTVVTSEPRKAASGSNWFCMKRTCSPNRLSVKTIAAAAANAPPEETPTSAGSARGFRNSPCMMAPDAASRPPTIAAAAIRGIRIDHSTSWSRAREESGEPSLHSPSAAGSRASGIPAAPTVSAISAAQASTISRPASVSAAEGRRAYPLRRLLVLGRLSATAVIAGNSPSARPAQTSPPAAPAPDRA